MGERERKREREREIEIDQYVASGEGTRERF